MRTNIDLDSSLIQEALRLSGHRTKRAVVDEALRSFVAMKKRRPLSSLFGKIRFSPGYDYRKLRTER